MENTKLQPDQLSMFLNIILLQTKGAEKLKEKAPQAFSSKKKNKNN